MFRQPTIRWKRSDEQELRRVVKNFNSKLSRIIKKNPEIAKYLPERQSYKDLRKEITSRQELTRHINSLKRFSQKGSEEIVISKTGLKTTKWERKEVGIQVAIINRERTRKRKILEDEEATSRGKSLNMTRREMNSIRMNELNKKKFDFDKIKKSDWERFKSTVRKQSHPNFQSEADLHLRENYIKGLIEVFGDNDDTNALIEQIRSMPLKDFITKFYKEQEATVDFIYDPIEAERKMKILKDDVWNNSNKANVIKRSKKNYGKHAK